MAATTELRGDLEVAHHETNPKTILGEGPCWDDEDQVLYWVDLKGKKLHVYHPDTKANDVVQLDQMIGTVVLRKNKQHDDQQALELRNELVVALERGIYYLDLKTKQLTLLDAPESDKPGNRFNDGKCDRRGRLWVGTMDNGEGKPLADFDPLGALYVLDPHTLKTKKVEDKTRISNGIAWSSDWKTMYFIDSPTRKVFAYDHDEERAEISNRREVAHIEDGFPDGMTIDTEGMLWVAHWEGGCVSRWNPHNGKLLGKVVLPVSRVTSCCFGGPNLDMLYITTASIGVDLTKEPLAGALFVFKNSGAKGFEQYPFAGPNRV